MSTQAKAYLAVCKNLKLEAFGSEGVDPEERLDAIYREACEIAREALGEVDAETRERMARDTAEQFLRRIE